MKQGLYILLSILLFCQCKKEGFDNLEETPVFGIETNFKGSDIDIQAGIDGYYMYSSFDQIDADHLILNGRLANESAETSSLTSPFEFEWNITTEIGSIDDLLSLSSLEYQTKNQVAVGVRMITLFNFNSDVHPSSVQMNWTIDNDLVSTEFYPVVPFETIASNQFTDVHLDFAIPNVMTGSFDAQLSFSDFCGGFLSIQKINENQFSFAVNPASDLPSDVLWSTGSTNGSTIRPREAQEIFVDIHAEDESCSSRIKVDIEDPDFNRLNIGFIPQQPALGNI